MQEGRGPKIELTLPKKSSTKRPRKSTSAATPSGSGSKQSRLPNTNSDSSWPPKRKKSGGSTSFAAPEAVEDDVWENDGDDSYLVDFDGSKPEVINLSEDSDQELSSTTLFSRSNGRPSGKLSNAILAENSSEEDDADVDFTFTLDGRPLKKARAKPPLPKDVEVIDVSDSS